MPRVLRQKNPSNYLAGEDQPYFRCYYGEPAIDITKTVFRANYEEQASLMTELTLTANNAEFLYAFLQVGGIISFWGGDLELGSGRNTVNYRKVFQGPIRVIKSDYQEDGEVYVTITCMKAFNSEAVNRTRSYTYPDISSSSRLFVYNYIRNNYDVTPLPDEFFGENTTIVDNNDLLQSIRSPLDVAVNQFDSKVNTDGSRYRVKYGNDISITYKAIIEGIAEENEWDFDDSSIVLPELAANKDWEQQPTLLAPATQDSQSDWSFLLKLCAILSCRAWLEVEKDTLKLFFVSLEGLSKPEDLKIDEFGIRRLQPETSFYFPRRGDSVFVSGDDRGRKLFDSFFYRNDSYNKKFGSATDRRLQMFDVSVIEDMTMLNAVTPQTTTADGEQIDLRHKVYITQKRVFQLINNQNRDKIKNQDKDFVVINGQSYLAVDEKLVDRNPITGKIKSVSDLGIQSIEKESDYVLMDADYFYEVDEVKILGLSPEKQNELNDKISQNNNNLTKKEYIYLKRVPSPIEKTQRIKGFDWRGVRINCKIDGNINIRSQRFYDVIGIIRYGSDSDNEKFYLRSLSHTWEDTGFETKLEFFK